MTGQFYAKSGPWLRKPCTNCDRNFVWQNGNLCKLCLLRQEKQFKAEDEAAKKK